MCWGDGPPGSAPYSVSRRAVSANSSSASGMPVSARAAASHSSVDSTRSNVPEKSNITPLIMR